MWSDRYSDGGIPAISTDIFSSPKWFGVYLRFHYWSSVSFKSGIIRAFYVLVKDNVDKLSHLEGTKVLFCDLQHTTLASDRGAKHTICLSVIDQVQSYHIQECPDSRLSLLG